MKRSPSHTAWMVAAAALMALPAVVRAQDGKPVVAILYFDNNSIGKDRGDYDGLGKGVADLLINDMAANPSVRVVERDRVQKLLEEQGLTKAGQIDNQTAVRLGKILQAQYMVTGGFMSDGRGHMVLTARAINVETSQITNPQKVQSSGDDVLGLIAQLSSKLNSDMKLPAMPRRVGSVSPSTGATQPAQQMGQAKSQKLDFKTAVLYSKALEEQDNGNNTKATELYRAVLAKFPDFPQAKAGLQKVAKTGD
jgi:TolB-like protein